MRPFLSLRRQITASRIHKCKYSSETYDNSFLPKPRLDYRSISERTEYTLQNISNRKSPIPHKHVLSVSPLYEEFKKLSKMLNERRSARSAIGDRIRKTGKMKTTPAFQTDLQDAKILKEEIMGIEEQVAELEEKLLVTASSIPNDTHPDSPVGPTSAAITLSTHGPVPIPATDTRDHVEIGRKLGLFDFNSASLVSGSSWYYLTNEGALLETALTNYALSIAINHGFLPVTTPDVVRLDIANRCGFIPRDQFHSPVSQMYRVQPSDGPVLSSPELVLAGTAEIPLAGMFANTVHLEAALPINVVGLGRAFRAEAGARGHDTRGLYRVHQFTKLELFSVTAKEKSEEMMETMKQIQIEILEGLELPFRVVDMPTEELGASAFRKYDIEAWMPGRGSWGEVSSLSNCTDYQSRRLHIRYRQTQAESASSPLPFAHTLNGTAAAIPRLIIALVENGVQFDSDGQVVGLNLPDVLRPFWVGGPGSVVQWVPASSAS